MTGYTESVNYWADRADAAEKRVAELEKELAAANQKIQDLGDVTGYVFDEGWTKGYRIGYQSAAEDAQRPEREF